MKASVGGTLVNVAKNFHELFAYVHEINLQKIENLDTQNTCTSKDCSGFNDMHKIYKRFTLSNVVKTAISRLLVVTITSLMH